MNSKGEIVVYQSKDGSVELGVKLEDNDVWLTQAQIAKLFNTTQPNISLHVKNIFKEGELERNSVYKESLYTASDGKTYKTAFYNLDAIISTGYRVHSKEGVRFRQWATKILREHITRGITINQKRLVETDTNANTRISRLEESNETVSGRIMSLNMAVNKFLGQMARRDVLNAVIDDVEHIKLKINDISRIQESVKEIQKNLEDIKKEIKKK